MSYELGVFHFFNLLILQFLLSLQIILYVIRYYAYEKFQIYSVAVATTSADYRHL